ncbi:unnamed protein product, partial [Coregonus sp. 'balchen']
MTLPIGSCRFLWGTCKQTGGTCPFSHKVAKEKVKLCGNKHTHNDLECKKKHTLVCPDFSSSGSFPRGAQCKKKHTLVCPDFSSSGSFPRGTQCKPQHRQRAKRTAPNPNPTTGPSTAKKARTVAAEGSAQADPGTPSSSSLGPHNTKLPSFISFSNSPEDTDPPGHAPCRRGRGH